MEEAYKILMEVESDKLIDEDSVNAEAIRRAENEGIIFVDEIDTKALYIELKLSYQLFLKFQQSLFQTNCQV